MRLAALSAILLPLLAACAAAQPMAFGQAYQLRAGLGDIPTTSAHEPAGWSVEQRHIVRHTAGSATHAALTLPAGSRILEASCGGCAGNHTVANGTVRFTVDAGQPSGPVTLVLSTTQPAATALAMELAIPTPDAVAILYVPGGYAAHAPGAPQSPGSSTDGSATIEVYGAQGGLGSSFWFALAPAAAATPAPPASPPLTPLSGLALAAAFAAGALLWALLVARGVVQRRSRKQVAQAAAHEEIAARDPRAVLEGRKRALMAALKEVEAARIQNEMDAATYDAVKADLKRQAVTVMRALEGGKGQEP